MIVAVSAPLDRYAGARVLVTGGLGFIGSHLAERLVGLGSEVTILDSLVPEYGGNPFNIASFADRVHVNYSDMRDPWSIRYLVTGKDFIFNLAGQVSHIDSMRDPQTDLDINCVSQLSLLEACRDENRSVVVVFAASRQQYGRPRFLPITEEHPQVPVDVNGINLVAGEAYHLLYHHVYGIRAVSLRLTNTYGPRLLMKHDRQGFITSFIRLAVHGEPINVFGDGSQLRDMTYVSDAVEAFLAAGLADDAYGTALNLGGFGPVSLREVAHLCQEVAGTGGMVETAPWPEDRARIDVGSVYLDHSRLTQLTGWRPTVDLREGLQRTIDFYRREGEHYWA
jgi:UDP-glucose 4-epimerase